VDYYFNHLFSVQETSPNIQRRSTRVDNTADNQRSSAQDRRLGLETARERSFAVIVLALLVLVFVWKDWSRLFSRPMNNNLLACMSRKNS